MILFLNTGREAVQRAACASNIEDNHCSGLSGDEDGDDGDDDECDGGGVVDDDDSNGDGDGGDDIWSPG